jgi:hypothetical protein
MSVTFIKRSVVPASVVGRQVTKATVTVAGNGQIQLNSLASKHFNGSVKFGLAVDKETGTVNLYPEGSPVLVKNKVATDQLFEFRVGKKTKTLFMAGTNILRSTDVFGDHLYDFAKSGNQTFDATIDEKTQALTFTLPKGALVPKPVTPRPRKSKVAPAVSAEAGSTAGTPVAEDELALDLS